MPELTMKDLDRLVAELRQLWRSKEGLNDYIVENIAPAETTMELTDKMWKLLLLSVAEEMDAGAEPDIEDTVQAVVLMAFLLGFEVCKQYG